MWTYSNDALADDGYVDLPDATFGSLTISWSSAGTAAGYIGTVGTAGSQIATATITNNAAWAATDSDGYLCLIDTGTACRFKNRTGEAGRVVIIYCYQE